MSNKIFCVVQAMNIVTAVAFVIVCLHFFCHQSVADTGNGALTVVEEDDNGVSLEVGNGEDDVLTDSEQIDSDPFHPTKEWQPVKKGQAVPAGLHVRMNFETGEKEAKLMDGDSEFKFWKDGDRQGMMNMDRKQFTMQELKNALKDFKTTQLDDTDLEHEAEVKKKFRSYDELKKDFHDMNMDIKTDGEIIGDLLDTLKKEDAPRDDVLTVLTDLEYYLHQIDNAVLFKDWGGLQYLLKILNKTSDEELQMEAAMVLGAATSSNPKVQIGALEQGALQLLLRLISTQSSANIRKKVLYCISSLCRQFPYAQKRFLELGGLSAVGSVFEEVGTEKLRVKTISFLNDLLREKISAEENISQDTVTSSDSEKLKQYKEVFLLDGMIEQGWCQRVPALLDVSDHGSRQQIFSAMQTLVQSCRASFIKSLDRLNHLSAEYVELALEETDGDYFANLVTMINSLIQNIKTKEEL